MRKVSSFIFPLCFSSNIVKCNDLIILKDIPSPIIDIVYSTHINKDLYQVQETLKKLCEFSTVWADWADLGSTETVLQTEGTSINDVRYQDRQGGPRQPQKSDVIEQDNVGRQVKNDQKTWDVINGRSPRSKCVWARVCEKMSSSQHLF